VRTGTDEPAALLPQPGLAALPDLLDQIRRAGLPVRLTVTPPTLALPAGIDLSVYRIVQEALTNTIKHAGPGARAEIRFGCESGELAVEVIDTGGTPTTASGPTPDIGNGLRGIRERAAALGGTAAFGELPGGGFRVTAVPASPGPRSFVGDDSGYIRSGLE